MAEELSLRDEIVSIASSESLPEPGKLLSYVSAASEALSGVAAETRPRSPKGRPGGLFELPRDRPTLVVPDLHARTGFLLDILGGSWCAGLPTLEALEKDLVSILFLGDGFHSERNGFDRWLAAWVDYRAGQPRGQAMRAEMRDSLALMEIVMLLVSRFPRAVTFLKGNHENVLNEEGEGNHPFRKYADEGQMVLDFFIAEYGIAALTAYADFEKLLPLVARGPRFIASHAEPLRAYGVSEIVAAPGNHEIVEGLTWTGNDESAEGSVEAMLGEFLPGVEGSAYFGGHRVIEGGYRARAGGRYFQLHDPIARSVACVPADRPFNPETDVRSVK